MAEKVYEFNISEATTLMPCLVENIKNQSRTTIKSYLTHRQVSVNNIITTQFNLGLKEGDVVRVRTGRAPLELKHPMLRIVFEDKHIIVIDKRNGLLSMATDKQREKTAYYILSDYIKLADPNNRLFILHRLDRETSGLMMFAKSEEVQSTMQKGWHTLVRERRYVAVVEGRFAEKSGEIRTQLVENKALKMYVPNDDSEGELAITRYKVLKQGKENTLVELELETGKKNQIRVHMEHLKAPIVGDKKYGAATSKINRVCLHAYVLNITHPVTGEDLDFETRVPQIFLNMIKQ